MKTNEVLQRDVQDAIKWEPLFSAAEIGVTAKDGIITLTGSVDNYPKKMEAENAAKNVSGVTAVVENIEIKFDGGYHKSDSDIAKEVINALKSTWQVPSDKVKIKVENGWITLEGTLAWNYQREATKAAVNHLAGVKGIMNKITIESEVKDKIEKSSIEEAIGRNWSINANDIEVKVSGTKVTLTGIVDSWYQKNEAGRIAWNAPGVWSVDNELVVEFNHSFVA